MGVKRQLLFIQGGGAAGVHDEWDARLVASLRHELGPAYEIRYPRMPDEADPHFAAWKAAIEAALAELDAGAVLIGHSLGGAALINTLSGLSPTRNFGALFLIAAPFIGDGGWSSDELKTPSDLGGRLSRNLPVHIYHGLEDKIVPPAQAELYARAVPQARIHCIAGRDHQFNDDLELVGVAIQSLGAKA